MAAPVTAKPELPVSKQRQCHLIAVVSALVGSIISAFLLHSTPASEDSSVGLLLAVTLPGAVVGAWAWAIVCGCIRAWHQSDDLGTAVAGLYMLLVLPITAIAAIFGVLGTRLLYASLPVILQWTSPEQIVLYNTHGLTNAGALGGASAAFIAHILWISGAIRRIMQAGHLNGERAKPGDRGDGV